MKDRTGADKVIKVTAQAYEEAAKLEISLLTQLRHPHIASIYEAATIL